MAAIAQTITMVDRSGKVMHTSKQLKNVLNEAKKAYLERRAEIKDKRKEKEERELQKAIKAMSIADDETSSSTSRPQARRNMSSHHYDDSRPRQHRRHLSGASSHRSSASGSPSSTRSPSQSPRAPLSQYNDDLRNTRSMPASPTSPTSHGLSRSRTDLDLATIPRPPRRSYSTQDLDHVDMDLAYGEYHPDSLGLQLDPKVKQKLQQQEMSSLVTKCKMLLEEADCAQHSVKAIVAHLQSNPDAMAAVALTLAEISNLATKMAPGALAGLKAGAPAVFAILAAPEFLIAVGVGVGITIVSFAGYKIIKKIRNKGKDREGSMDEAIDVEELDRIEHWRRGIADVGRTDGDETASVLSAGTSVEGEYITPMAARSMGHLPQKNGKSSKKDKDGEKKKKKKHRTNSDLGSETSKSSRRSSKSDALGVPRDKQLIKVKKPSPLRRMFTSKDTNSTAS